MKKLYPALFLLGGCMVGPNYKTPENNVSATWSAPSENISAEAPVTKWWEVFGDPLLNKYIAIAAEYNNDVLSATSNILQARALRQVAASSFFPQIGADVNATRTYFSKNGPVFAIGPSTGSVPGTISPITGLPITVQIPQTQNLYNILFDASWELDFFGKTRRTVEAADAVVGSTIDKRNDVLLTVMAEIARGYIELRGLQTRVGLVEENISLLEKKAVLVRKQLEAGYVSRIDDETIQATLAAERALLPELEALIYRSIYTLSVLIGTAPETLVAELLTTQPLPKAPEIVFVGLRSDLLLRRPDVRKAERDLAAATANIGVAVAAFFPTITLLGDGGLQSLMLNNLFSLGSKTWALGADFNLPIFEGGRLTGNLKAKKAETAAVAYTYQQTVLKALEEAESGITSYTQGLKTIQQTKDETLHYKELVLISEQRYAKGLTSILNVLDTERQLNSAEQTLLASETATLLQLVTLYKALGGGWEIE